MILADDARCPMCGSALAWSCYDNTGRANCLLDGKRTVWVRLPANWRPCPWKGAPVTRGEDGRVYLDPKDLQP